MQNLSELPRECLDMVLSNINEGSLFDTALVCGIFRSSVLQTCYLRHRDNFMVRPSRRVFFPENLEAKRLANLAILGLEQDKSMTAAEKIKNIAMIFSSVTVSAQLMRLLNLFMADLKSENGKILFKDGLERFLAALDTYYWSSDVLSRFALDNESTYYICYHIPLLLIDAHPNKVDIIRQTIVRLLSYTGKLDGSPARSSNDLGLYNVNGVLWALKTSKIQSEEARCALLPIADMIWHFFGRDKMIHLRVLCREKLGIDSFSEYDERIYRKRIANPDNVYMALITLDESNIEIQNILYRFEDPLIIECLMPFYKFMVNIMLGNPQSFTGFTQLEIRALASFLRSSYKFGHDDLYSNYFWTIEEEGMAEWYVALYITVLGNVVSARLKKMKDSSTLCPDIFPSALWGSIRTIILRDTEAQKLLKQRIEKDFKSAASNKDFSILKRYDFLMRECKGFNAVFDLVTEDNLFNDEAFTKEELEFLFIHMANVN